MGSYGTSISLPQWLKAVASADAQDLGPSVHAAIRLLGFEHLLLVCAGTRADVDATSVFSTLDPRWVRHYQSAKLAEADPCIACARHSTLPSFVVADDTIEASPAWHAWMRACELGAFVVVSFHGPGNELVVAEFGLDSSQLPRATTHWLSGCTADALLLAHVLHSEKLRGPGRSALGSASQASERELECLALASLGHKCDDIAQRLQISVHTVRFHLRSVRMRLKTRTVSAALAVAMQDPHMSARIACHACALGPCMTID